jgi:hypothetical protein
LYNLACVYSLAAAAAQKDVALPPAGRARLAEQYAARAVSLLTRAHAAGYFRDRDKAKNLATDHDLDALRSREDFRELLAGLMQ